MVLYIMPYKVLACGLSDIGLVRQSNEDVWAQLPEELFFTLADGMGGHQAGEVAAKEAVNNLCAIFKQQFASSDKSLSEARRIIIEAIQQVNSHIYDLGSRHKGLKGMGTTLCCILLHQEGLIYGHVGDSRIYRFRDHQLKQLTRDHSLVRELIDLGQLDEQQADDFLYKNIITKAIGTESYVEPTVEVDELQIVDTILMCTDGLTDMLSDEEIEEILDKTSDQNLAKSLIKAAKQKGAHDNVTVVVVKVQEKHDSADLS